MNEKPVKSETAIDWIAGSPEHGYYLKSSAGPGRVGYLEAGFCTPERAHGFDDPAEAFSEMKTALTVQTTNIPMGVFTRRRTLVLSVPPCQDLGIAHSFEKIGSAGWGTGDSIYRCACCGKEEER